MQEAPRITNFTMEFVNPAFLFGLLAIGVPIVIHLFNFRKYQRIYFTNVRFLKELKEQTKKRSQLRHLLILALRILAIACLAIAFAQPYIPFQGNKHKADARSAVSIYVDNSFSMEALGSHGSLLEEAKQKAREIASAYKASDVFQLLTNDFEGKQQRLVSRDDFYRMLPEITVSPVTRRLSEVILRQKDLLNTSTSTSKSAFILSDFQHAFSNIAALSEDSSLACYLVPLAEVQANNLYIDSCWFDSPVQQAGFPARLHVKLSNTSHSDFEKLPVKVMVNNKQKAVATVNIMAGSSSEIVLSFINYEDGICQGIVEITDYPVTFDDKFYFSYNVTNAMAVLAIDGEAGNGNAFLNALYAGDSSLVYEHMQEKKLDYSSFSKYNLIILNGITVISSGLAQELKRFMDNGGGVSLVPAAGADLVSYNAFLRDIDAGILSAPDTTQMKVSNINLNHPLFRDVFDIPSGKLTADVDLPVVFSHYPIHANSRNVSESLMRLTNGDDFLTAQPVGEGLLFLLASPLDIHFSNFPKQALFVPVFYNMALLSRPATRLYYTIGRDELIRVTGERLKNDQVYTIRNNTGNFDFIPGKVEVNSVNFVQAHGQIMEAGNYAMLAGSKRLMGISFDYNRNESDLKFFTADELLSMLEKKEMKHIGVLRQNRKAVGQAISELNLGKQYWKLFVVAALLFLLGEVLMIRIWKT